MVIRDVMWDIFRHTGHIGAYLIYKDYQRIESSENISSGRDLELGENKLEY